MSTLFFLVVQLYKSVSRANLLNTAFKTLYAGAALGLSLSA